MDDPDSTQVASYAACEQFSYLMALLIWKMLIRD